MLDRQYTPESLIREVEEIKNRTELPFERRLADLALWYHKNKDRIPRENIPKRMDFLEKFFDITLELMAMTAERLQTVEGRRSSSLYTPRGLSYSGSLKKFG